MATTTPDWDAWEEQFAHGGWAHDGFGCDACDTHSVHVKHMPCPHNAVTLEHDPRRLVCVECGEEVEPSWMR